MEQVAAAAADYLSFQGCRGAPFTELCAQVAAALSGGPPAGGAPAAALPAAARERLWQALRDDAASFGLFCAQRVAGVTAEAAAHVDGTPRPPYAKLQLRRLLIMAYQERSEEGPYHRRMLCQTAPRQWLE